MSETKPRYVMMKMADRPAYLIGRIMEESDSEVVLYYPVIIAVYVDEQGMQVITSKYMPFAKDDLVSIVKTSIHGIASPNDKLINAYKTFMKNYRDSGQEKVLEARILGEREPIPELAIPTLDEEPPMEDEMIH